MALPTLPMLPQDKANHALAGLLVYLPVAALAGPVEGAAAAAVVGAAKEAWDATGRGRVEWGDFFATAAGGLLGLACSQI